VGKRASGVGLERVRIFEVVAVVAAESPAGLSAEASEQLVRMFERPKQLLVTIAG
jgi:hypothetical protein